MDLFDYKKPVVEIVKVPTRAQLRMLHLMRMAELSFHSWPYKRIEIKETGSQLNKGWNFKLVTAQLIVERGWADLQFMDMRKGEGRYQLTAAGRALTEEICNCAGRGLGELAERGAKSHEKQIDAFAGKLLCKSCSRLVPCVSRKPMVHAGSKWDFKLGVVCETHWRRLA